MKKNYRVITINGFRGILMAAFIVLGLISGFIISPAWVCMHIWNYALEDVAPSMNLFQGILLWCAIAISLYALNNRRSLIGFGTYPRLSSEQIKDIMNRAQLSEPQILNEIEALKKELNKTPVDSAEEETSPSVEAEQQKEEIRG